jgi:hypothetical protein
MQRKAFKMNQPAARTAVMREKPTGDKITVEGKCMTLYVQSAAPKPRSPLFPEMIDQFTAATVIRTTDKPIG